MIYIALAAWLVFLIIDGICYKKACARWGPFMPRYGSKALLPGSGIWFIIRKG